MRYISGEREEARVGRSSLYQASTGGGRGSAQARVSHGASVSEWRRLATGITGCGKRCRDGLWVCHVGALLWGWGGLAGSGQWSSGPGGLSIFGRAQTKGRRFILSFSHAGTLAKQVDGCVLIMQVGGCVGARSWDAERPRPGRAIASWATGRLEMGGRAGRPRLWHGECCSRRARESAGSRVDGLASRRARESHGKCCSQRARKSRSANAATAGLLHRRQAGRAAAVGTSHRPNAVDKRGNVREHMHAS